MAKNGDIFWFKKTGTFVLNGTNDSIDWSTWKKGINTFPFEIYKEEPKIDLYDYLKALDL